LWWWFEGMLEFGVELVGLAYFVRLIEDWTREMTLTWY
jgi:hypothetical protein